MSAKKNIVVRLKGAHMKKRVLVVFCIMMILLCSCSNTRIAESEGNPIESVENTSVGTTEKIETSEDEQQTESEEYLDLNDYSIKYLGEYEIDSILSMEKVIEFDLNNWINQIISINTAGLVKEDIIKMVQNDEIDWETISKTDNSQELQVLIEQFLDIYTYNKGFQFTEETKRLYLVALADMQYAAKISTEEWQEFKKVFAIYKEKESEYRAEYFAERDAAWDEYSQIVDTAWEEYDSKKSEYRIEYETRKEEINAQYNSDLEKLRNEYFENNNLSKYEKGKLDLNADKLQALDEAEKNYNAQVKGSEQISSLYSQYESKKETARNTYEEREKAASEKRNTAIQEALLPVEGHEVYKKMYEITDTDVWKKLLITIGNQ